MTSLSFERQCAEIVAQTKALAVDIEGADLTVPVPTCPGWNGGQLLRHLGGGQHWAAEIVRTRASEPPPDDYFRDLSPYTDEDPAVVGPYLKEGAARLADALDEAGPAAQLWTPIPGRASAFYARRFLHETVIHRADAELALGNGFELAPEIAVDGIDEWMELESLPMMFDVKPGKRELLGPGRTIHLHATDAEAEWILDLSGDAIDWRRSHEKAALVLRGPVSELLLVIYLRRPARGDGIEILGDTGLLDFWLARASFG